MGSLGAMARGSADRYFQQEVARRAEAGARGDRGPGALSRARSPTSSTSWWAACAPRMGYTGNADLARDAARLPVPARHPGGPARGPRPRRRDHPRGAELPPGNARGLTGVTAQAARPSSASNWPGSPARSAKPRPSAACTASATTESNRSSAEVDHQLDDPGRAARAPASPCRWRRDPNQRSRSPSSSRQANLLARSVPDYRDAHAGAGARVSAAGPGLDQKAENSPIRAAEPSRDRPDRPHRHQRQRGGASPVPARK